MAPVPFHKYIFKKVVAILVLAPTFFSTFHCPLAAC